MWGLLGVVMKQIGDMKALTTHSTKLIGTPTSK
jgi:hypothetical protein